MVKEISPPSARYTAPLDNSSSSRLPIPSKSRQPSLFAKPKSTQKSSSSAVPTTATSRKRTILGDRNDIDNVSISSSRGRLSSGSKGISRSPMKRPVTIVSRVASSSTTSATATPRGLPVSRLSLGKKGTPHPRRSMTMAFPRAGDESQLLDAEPPEWISGLSSPASSDIEDAETTFRGHVNARSGAVMGFGRMMTPADSQEAPTGRPQQPSTPIDRRSRLPTPPSSQVNDDLPLPASFSSSRASRVHPRPAPTPPRQTREAVSVTPQDPSPNPRKKKSQRVELVAQSPSQASVALAVSRPLSASTSVRAVPSSHQLPSTPLTSLPSTSLRHRAAPTTAPPARRRKSNAINKKTPSPKKSRKSLPAPSAKLKPTKSARKSLSVREIVKITGTPLGRLSKKVEAEPGDDELLLKEEEDDDLWLRKRRMSRSLSMSTSSISMRPIGNSMASGHRNAKAGPSRLRNVIEVEIVERGICTTPRQSSPPREHAHPPSDSDERIVRVRPAGDLLGSAAPEEDSGSYDIQYDEAPGWTSDDATEIGDDEESGLFPQQTGPMREDTVVDISDDIHNGFEKEDVIGLFEEEHGISTPRLPSKRSIEHTESTTPLGSPGIKYAPYTEARKSPLVESSGTRPTSPLEDADITQEAISDEWDLTLEHSQPIFEDHPESVGNTNLVSESFQHEDIDFVREDSLPVNNESENQGPSGSSTDQKDCARGPTEAHSEEAADKSMVSMDTESTQEAIAVDWYTSTGEETAEALEVALINNAEVKVDDAPEDSIDNMLTRDVDPTPPALAEVLLSSTGLLDVPRRLVDMPAEVQGPLSIITLLSEQSENVDHEINVVFSPSDKEEIEAEAEREAEEIVEKKQVEAEVVDQYPTGLLVNQHRSSPGLIESTDIDAVRKSTLKVHEYDEGQGPRSLGDDSQRDAESPPPLHSCIAEQTPASSETNALPKGEIQPEINLTQKDLLAPYIEEDPLPLTPHLVDSKIVDGSLNVAITPAEEDDALPNLAYCRGTAPALMQDEDDCDLFDQYVSLPPSPKSSIADDSEFPPVAGSSHLVKHAETASDATEESSACHTIAADIRSTGSLQRLLTTDDVRQDEDKFAQDEDRTSDVGDVTADGDRVDWDDSIDASRSGLLPTAVQAGITKSLKPHDLEQVVDNAEKLVMGIDTRSPIAQSAMPTVSLKSDAMLFVAEQSDMQELSPGEEVTDDYQEDFEQPTAAQEDQTDTLGHRGLYGADDTDETDEMGGFEGGEEEDEEEEEEEVRQNSLEEEEYVEGVEHQAEDADEQGAEEQREQQAATEGELDCRGEANQDIVRPPRRSTRIVLRVVDRGIVKIETPPPSPLARPAAVGALSQVAFSPGDQLLASIPDATLGMPLPQVSESGESPALTLHAPPPPVNTVQSIENDSRSTRSPSAHRYANALPGAVSTLESKLVRRQSASSSSSTRPSRLSVVASAPVEQDIVSASQDGSDNDIAQHSRPRTDATANKTSLEDVGNDSFKSVVEVSSLDPRAAARAAAILKLNHAYIEHGVLPSPTSTPASTVNNLPTPSTPGRAIPRTPKSEGRRKKWESKHFSTAESARKLNRDELLYEAELEIVAAQRSRSQSRAKSLGAASERGWQSDETEYAVPGGWKVTPGKRKRARSVRAQPSLLPPIEKTTESQVDEKDSVGKQAEKQAERPWSIPDWKKLEKVYRAEKQAWIEERQVKPLPGLFGWAKKVLSRESDVKEWDIERVVERFVEAENAKGLSGEWAEKMILLRVKALEKRVNTPQTARTEKDDNHKRDNKKPRIETKRTERVPSTPTRDTPDEGNSTVVSIVPPSTIRRMLGYVWKPSLGDTSIITEADASIDNISPPKGLNSDEAKGKAVEKVENKFLSRLKHGSDRTRPSSSPASASPSSVESHSTPMKKGSLHGISTPPIAHPASPAWTPPFPGAFRSSFNRPHVALPTTPTTSTSTLSTGYSPGLVGFSTPKIYPSLNPPFTQRSSALKALFDTPSSSTITKNLKDGIAINRGNASPSVSALVKSFEEEGTFAKNHEKIQARQEELKRVQSRE